MEFFRFVAWQWGRFSFEDATLVVMIISAAATLIACLLNGFTIGMSGVVALFAFMCTGLLSAICRRILTQWKKYKIFKDREAQSIVDRLRG